MDLTLECVRRYYRHEDSPLAPVLGRYAGFFALFEDFQGYVDFFLLQPIKRPLIGCRLCLRRSARQQAACVTVVLLAAARSR